MNFLVCDAVWLQGPGGELSCSGQLRSITSQEVFADIKPSAITLEESTELVWLTAGLFAAVFVVLVLKKVL